LSDTHQIKKKQLFENRKVTGSIPDGITGFFH
jgi:hypothetical protein